MEKVICFPAFVHLPFVLAHPSAVRIELTLAASPVPGRSLASEELRNALSRGSSRPLDEVTAASLPASPWAESGSHRPLEASSFVSCTKPTLGRWRAWFGDR